MRNIFHKLMKNKQNNEISIFINELVKARSKTLKIYLKK